MRRKNLSWQLPAEIEARLGDGSYGRQRAMFEANHLLIILHQPPSGDDVDREAIAFLRKPEGQYECDGLDNGELRLRKLLAAYRERWEECDKK